MFLREDTKSLKARSYLKNALSVIPTKQCIYIQVMTFEMRMYVCR